MTDQKERWLALIKTVENELISASYHTGRGELTRALAEAVAEVDRLLAVVAAADVMLAATGQEFWEDGSHIGPAVDAYCAARKTMETP